MKWRILLFVWLSCAVVQAQVGIGTLIPNEVAALDVEASDKGILIPRVALHSVNEQLSSISPNPNSLLIFNTRENAELSAGFYYWYKDKWYKVLSEVDSITETLTYFVENGDGTLSYFNELGKEFIFPIIMGPPGKDGKSAYELALENGFVGTELEWVSKMGMSDSFWNKQNIKANEKDNDEAIYYIGAVSIAKNRSMDNVLLDVAGAVRFGSSNQTNIGNRSFAVGTNMSAEGNNSIAFGSQTKALGNQAFAVGSKTQASGLNSVSFGNDSQASGSSASSFGQNTEATGTNAVSFGENTHSHSRNEFVIGRYNAVRTGAKTTWTASNAIFQIGIGIDSINTKNALTILKDGKVGIGIHGKENNAKPKETLHIGKGEADPNFVRIEDLPNLTGSLSDKLVVVSPSGVLNSIETSALMANGSWFKQGTSAPAESNLDPSYLMGAIAIGKNRSMEDVLLDVAGAARIGSSNQTNIGNRSFAVGTNMSAEGNNSVAFGSQTKALGNQAFAVGSKTQASGLNSVSYGNGSQASGSSASSFGQNTEAAGTNAVSFGENTHAHSRNEFVIGRYNAVRTGAKTTWTASNAIFQVGIGTDSINTKNALTILKDGKVGIGLHGQENNAKPKETFHIGKGEADPNLVRIEDLPNLTGSLSDKLVVVSPSGILNSIETSALMANGSWFKQGTSAPAESNLDPSYLMGAVAVGKNRSMDNVLLDVAGAARFGSSNQTNIGNRSFAVGTNMSAEGNNSVAFGSQTKALGNQAFAVGSKTQASGLNSVSFGNDSQASGSSASSFGQNTKAAGTNAVSFGENTHAHSRNEFVIGRYNAVLTGAKTTWTESNAIFQIGIGADSLSRKNAITVRKNGWVGIGTLTNNRNELLNVDGSIASATEVYPDYVFESFFDGESKLNPDYNYMDLDELKEFLVKNRHLPNILPISKLDKNDKGEFVVNITELSIQLLEKVEELYLHLIQQKERNDSLEQRLSMIEEILNTKAYED